MKDIIDIEKAAIGIGGKIKESKKIWLGKWYKPWTWFKYGFEIKDFELMEFSFVPDFSNRDAYINKEIEV